MAKLHELTERLPEDILQHSRRVAVLTDYYQFPDKNLETTEIALLHDLIEDTDSSLDEIESEGTRKAVDILTRRTGESYFQYIQRIANSGNADAIVVKISDLTDHLLQVKTLKPSLKARYEKALSILQEVEPSIYYDSSIDSNE